MVKITIPNKYTFPGSPYYDTVLVELANYTGRKSAVVNNEVTFHDELAEEFDNIGVDRVDWNTVQYIVAHEGEVEGLPMYIKMSKVFAETTTVPEYLPNSSITDEESNETQKLWVDYTPIHIYDDIVVVKEGSDGAKYFLGSQYVQLSQIDGIEIMTKQAFKEREQQFISDNINE